MGYDRENVDKGGYRGLTQTDRYGRIIPKAAHGTVRFDACLLYTSLLPVNGSTNSLRLS